VVPLPARLQSALVVDPPWDAKVEHFWDFEITGLQPGQIASLVDSNHEEIIAASARAGQAVRLTALVSPAVEREVTLLRDAHGFRAPGFIAHQPFESRTASGDTSAAPQMSAEHGGSDLTGSDMQKTIEELRERGIEVRQRLLWHTASIPVESDCRRIVASTYRARRGVAATVEDGIVTFDLSNPYRPVCVGSWHQPGLSGVCSWQYGLLAFGPDGFVSIDSDAAMKSIGPECESDAVMDAIAGAGVVYVLTSEALEVRTLRLCRMSGSPVAGGRSMIRAGRRLVVGGRNGLAMYDISEANRPRLETSRDDLNVTALALPPEEHANALLAVLEDRSARILSLHEGRLHETATYSRGPWFADSVRLGRLVVRVGADRLHLNVGLFGETCPTGAA
jgi:hypothetical protein